MNWFIAWPVDGAKTWLDALEALPHGVRAFAPDDVHVTVAFFGACGEARARAAWDAARAERMAATTFAGGPLLPFGSRAKPSAYAVESHDRVFIDFIAAHRDRLLALAGARPEDRAPRAHATLVRPSRAATADDHRASKAWAARQHVVGALPITRLALYTWAEDRRARLFRVVDEVALDEAALPAPA